MRPLNPAGALFVIGIFHAELCDNVDATARRPASVAEPKHNDAPQQHIGTEHHLTE